MAKRVVLKDEEVRLSCQDGMKAKLLGKVSMLG